MGHGVASGLEFGNLTHTHVTRDHDTVVLPIPVMFPKVDGVVSIWHNIYNTLKGLAPAWVSPKSPNLTRDNSILMVVKGNHCGKYVTWIHHRYYEDNGDKQAIILLAVFNKVEGTADTLTRDWYG